MLIDTISLAYTWFGKLDKDNKYEYVENMETNILGKSDGNHTNISIASKAPTRTERKLMRHTNYVNTITIDASYDRLIVFDGRGNLHTFHFDNDADCYISYQRALGVVSNRNDATFDDVVRVL